VHDARAADHAHEREHRLGHDGDATLSNDRSLAWP
jgi:hypothetical protein